MKKRYRITIVPEGLQTGYLSRYIGDHQWAYELMDERIKVIVDPTITGSIMIRCMGYQTN